MTSPYIHDPDFALYVGDALDVLSELPDATVDTCVTSPPYWGLRDYGTGVWQGGDPSCDHEPDRDSPSSTLEGGKATQGQGRVMGRTCSRCGATRVEWTGGDPDCDHAAASFGDATKVGGFQGKAIRANPGYAAAYQRTRQVCPTCGARKADRQLGLEASPDEYVDRLVDVFREVRRVLKPTGTLWLNLGDTYVDKSLVGIPWMVAFALRSDGWLLRSDVVWSKPNPMPESISDRPTKSHEYVFMFAKSGRYYFDQEAVREAFADSRMGNPGVYRSTYATDPRAGGKMAGRPDGQWNAAAERLARRPQIETLDGSEGEAPRGADGRRQTGVQGRDGSIQHRDGERWPNVVGRNCRSVWEIATRPYSDAHFATFPEDLPLRCIRATTSEHGVCTECGAPWERIVLATAPDGRQAVMRNGKAYDDDGRPLMGDNMIQAGVRGSFDSGGDVLDRTTIGWRATCDHDGPTEPATVLDPFMGSGTTAVVARKLGRRSVGVELSAEYAQLCARRTRQLSLLASP